MELDNRMISAEWLKTRCYEICDEFNTERLHIDRIVDEIDNAPDVDAVEVVHGRWINPYINRYGHPCHCCSECGFKASYQDKNYCPNCGAKMRGSEE